MFDISFFELLIISMVALIVVGPERLPQVARTLGHLFGRCRNLVYGIKTDIHNEIRMEELKNMHNSVQETAQSIENSFRQEIEQLKSAADVTALEKNVVEIKEQVKASVDGASPSSAVQQPVPEVSGPKPISTEKEEK